MVDDTRKVYHSLRKGWGAAPSVLKAEKFRGIVANDAESLKQIHETKIKGKYKFIREDECYRSSEKKHSENESRGHLPTLRGFHLIVGNKKGYIEGDSYK